MRRRRTLESLEVCVDRFSLDPTIANVFSAISRAFVECYLETKAERYVSEFSRVISEKLNNSYLCGRLQRVFQQLSKRFDEIATVLAKRYTVYELQLLTKSRLLVNAKGGQLPFEISIAWDTVFNIPFIPSSSIKGAVRAYFEEFVGSISGYSVEKLFGSEEEEGLIRFTDAYPVFCKQTLIEPEVISPHYPEVAGNIDEASSSPIPLVFLVVSPGVIFRLLFAVKADRTPVLDSIAKNVADALSKGVGAKTMLGYGLFTTQIVYR